MNKLKIVTQTPALRCEVCHQSDLFDSQTNHCNRCQNISHLVNTLNRTPRRVDVRETATNNFFKIALFWLLTICGFPLALYISYLFLANGILAVVI
ncbi:MAG: hypothetical protein JNN15_11055, partial [Blastocatellia bacterium]|nr:hypothetical protein [Blastocatellia bacterium]